MALLEDILQSVQAEMSAARVQHSLSDLRLMIADAPPVIALEKNMRNKFCLIAEIKEKTPSMGAMRVENVRDAPQAYEHSPVVQAISVLTNFSYFGMSIQRLGEIRKHSLKPILRKDFIIDEYQIWEARAFGADAVLLIANVLDVSRLRGFYNLIRELGMEALFEIQTDEDISILPPDAQIIGINSRSFRRKSGVTSRATDDLKNDFSVDLNTFHLVEKLPVEAIRVAESGLYPATLRYICSKFQAALVGTALLCDKLGVQSGLADFEAAMR